MMQETTGRMRLKAVLTRLPDLCLACPDAWHRYGGSARNAQAGLKHAKENNLRQHHNRPFMRGGTFVLSTASRHCELSCIRRACVQCTQSARCVHGGDRELVAYRDGGVRARPVRRRHLGFPAHGERDRLHPRRPPSGRWPGYVFGVRHLLRRRGHRRFGRRGLREGTGRRAGRPVRLRGRHHHRRRVLRAGAVEPGAHHLRRPVPPALLGRRGAAGGHRAAAGLGDLGGGPGARLRPDPERQLGPRPRGRDHARRGARGRLLGRRRIAGGRRHRHDPGHRRGGRADPAAVLSLRRRWGASRQAVARVEPAQLQLDPRRGRPARNARAAGDSGRAARSWRWS